MVVNAGDSRNIRWANGSQAQCGNSHYALGLLPCFFVLRRLRLCQTRLQCRGCCIEIRMMETNEILTTAEKLNMETARIPWSELQRLYAQGVVMVVSLEIDLVTVGAAFVDDQANLVKGWLEAGQLRKATDDDARNWCETNAEVWAVAAAPWVLVQPPQL